MQIQLIQEQKQSLNELRFLKVRREANLDLVQLQPFSIKGQQLSKQIVVLATHMNFFEVFYQNKSQDDDQYQLQNIDEILFEHPRHSDPKYAQNKDQLLEWTNYIEKTKLQDSRQARTINCIEISKAASNGYVYTKKGQPDQTIELLPNFKTFIVRKVKDLLLMNVLNMQQTANAIDFIKNKPSFKTFNSLFHPRQKCKKLRDILADHFSSPEIVRQLISSGIRLSQKLLLLKYLERMRDELQNPGKGAKWKKLYLRSDYANDVED